MAALLLLLLAALLLLLSAFGHETSSLVRLRARSGGLALRPSTTRCASKLDSAGSR